MKYILILALMMTIQGVIASDSVMYQKGLELAPGLVKAPSNPSDIPGYQGGEVSEKNYFENSSKLSEDANNKLYNGEATSKDSTLQAGSLLRDVVQDKPLFKMEETDSLIKDANEIVANPEAVVKAEVEEESTPDTIESTTHTCVEEGDPYTVHCQRDLAVQTIHKSKEYLHTRIWGWSHQYYDYTVKNEALPEMSINSFDGCNYWPRTVMRIYRYFKGFSGETRKEIQKTEYDFTLLNPDDSREQWISNCDSLEEQVDQGHCHYVEKHCTQGPATRNINGYAVHRDCWQEHLTYTCQRPVKNTCSSLRLNGCSQINSTCKEKVGDVCVLYEQTFECTEVKEGTKKVSLKGNIPFCMDGNCSKMGIAPNTDMAEALSKLVIFKEMQGQMDAKANSIFKGQSYACSRNCVNFKDCCATGKGWGVSLGLSNCGEEEKALAKFREEKKCIYVGTYCAEKALGICLRKKSNYCCFGSKLARLLHEQGRAQLGLGFGDAEHPQCRGFTIDELQHVRFDLLNLSELYEDLQAHKVLPTVSRMTEELYSNWQAKIPTLEANPEALKTPSQPLEDGVPHEVVF
ncbi:conjugal transfer protein TraN [Candidatus Nucleicultrix amoebiphila]|uniref:conjugal transfer protein TraN n=1 Tax=Candidatus Nucleicultrix amoebiphila TaxID=1509244 RepID=UPI000A269888|nr:conjugal transfer protein TraN [Candidatus Nucleicultrix amoebiphila]